jgi:hypothetical protein
MFDLGGRIFNIQFFASSGTYTPTKGTKSALVICVGGGGGAKEGGVGSATNGGSSSLGSLISCGGGGGSSGTVPGTTGAVTGADVEHSPGGGAGSVAGAWLSNFLGYGRGGAIYDTSSSGLSYERGFGGPGGVGIKVIKEISTQTITVGTGGTSVSAAGSVSRSDGRTGCVIVIEMK